MNEDTDNRLSEHKIWLGQRQEVKHPAKLHKVEKNDEGQEGPDFMFWCPACQCGHGVWTTQPNGHTGAVWEFNGNFESPTISPSLLIHHGKDGKEICHVVVSLGILNYCSDCTHSMAGKSIPMEEF